MGLDPVRQFLSEHPFFREMAPAARAEIEQRGALRRLARGEILGLEGEPCEAVYFVLEGRILAVKASPEGREQVVNELHAGEPFYLAPLFDGGPLPATTRAATRASVLGFRRQAFEELLDRYPALCRQVAASFARRLRRLGQLAEDLALRTVPQRLARLLLERGGAPGARSMTQKEMAAQLGTVREVVARTLGQFEREGWIRQSRGVIEIVDPQALRDLGA